MSGGFKNENGFINEAIQKKEVDANGETTTTISYQRINFGDWEIKEAIEKRDPSELIQINGY